ncbi:hypothetical protein [Maridesulfovibrio sp.]|uniref:hypothetical protein n=1 Tax=unclassified Maridesulfovibrio TaxID=2794999 RepID=UPI003B009788
MTRVIIDRTLEFSFPANWKYSVYDETDWQNEFKRIQGICSVDLILLDPDKKTLYLIEAKDYEKVPENEEDECKARTKVNGLPQKFSQKAAGTIAGLTGAQMCVKEDIRDFYNALLDTEYTKHFILFLELGRLANDRGGTGKTMLMNLGIRTKNSLMPICSEKGVFNIETLPIAYGWTVARI